MTYIFINGSLGHYEDIIIITSLLPTGLSLLYLVTLLIKFEKGIIYHHKFTAVADPNIASPLRKFHEKVYKLVMFSGETLIGSRNFSSMWKISSDLGKNKKLYNMIFDLIFL